MKTIRTNTFETNSSSTHSIVIPKEVKEEEYSSYDSLEHNYSFGREECRLVDNWDEKLAYVYIVLKQFYEWGNYDKDNSLKHTIKMEDIVSFKQKVKNIWDKMFDNEIKPTPEHLFDYIDEDKDDGNLIDNGILYLSERWGNFVDHFAELDDFDFLDRIMNDEDFLKRFLFNKDSYITIGGDEYRGYNIKKIGFEYDYESGDHRMNEKGELPPKEWLDENGCIKEEYWDRYWNEYTLETGEFWDKLREYEKDNDVYLKGN